MKCQDCREKIGPFLMEDLEADERRQLERHLEGCPQCRQEREMLSETLQQLSSLQEAAVPNHFFIEPQQPRLGPLQLWARLTPLWKGAFAVLALAVLAAGAAAANGLQFRIEEGALLAGFGPLPARDAAGLDQERAAVLLQTVERQLQHRDKALTIALQSQLANLRSDLRQERRQGIEALLTGFEQRLAQSWRERDARLRLEVRDYVEAAYGDVRSQYRQDLAVLGRQLEEFALRDDLQDERISLVSSAFLRIVDGAE